MKIKRCNFNERHILLRKTPVFVAFVFCGLTLPPHQSDPASEGTVIARALCSQAGSIIDGAFRASRRRFLLILLCGEGSILIHTPASIQDLALQQLVECVLVELQNCRSAKESQTMQTLSMAMFAWIFPDFS